MNFCQALEHKITMSNPEIRHQQEQTLRFESFHLHQIDDFIVSQSSLLFFVFHKLVLFK